MTIKKKPPILPHLTIEMNDVAGTEFRTVQELCEYIEEHYINPKLERHHENKTSYQEAKKIPEAKPPESEDTSRGESPKNKRQNPVRRTK